MRKLDKAAGKEVLDTYRAALRSSMDNSPAFMFEMIFVSIVGELNDVYCDCMLLVAEFYPGWEY